MRGKMMRRMIAGLLAFAMAATVLLADVGDFGTKTGVSSTVSASYEGLYIRVGALQNGSISPYYRVNNYGEFTELNLYSRPYKHYEANGGNTINLVIKPNEGYSLVEGSLSVTYTSDVHPTEQVISLDGTTFVMPDESGTEVMVTAAFEEGTPPQPTSYTIESSVINGADTGNSISLSTESAQPGDTVTVSLNMNPGTSYEYISAYKTGDNQTSVALTPSTESENTWTFTMPEYNVKVVTAFAFVTYGVSIIESESMAETGCTLSLNMGTANYGDEIIVTAALEQYTVMDGALLAYYSVDNAITYLEVTDIGNNQYSFSMPDHDVIVTAEFAREGHEISLNSTDTNGIELEGHERASFNLSVGELSLPYNNRRAKAGDRVDVYAYAQENTNGTGSAAYTYYMGIEKIYITWEDNGVTQTEILRDLVIDEYMNASGYFIMPESEVTITSVQTVAYAIVRPANDGFTMNVSKIVAKPGEKITAQIVPDENTGGNYPLHVIKWMNSDVVAVSLSANDPYTWEFTMPDRQVELRIEQGITRTAKIKDGLPYGIVLNGACTVLHAAPGDKITVSVKEGNKPDDVQVKTLSGNSVPVAAESEQFTFTLPDEDVIVDVGYHYKVPDEDYNPVTETRYEYQFLTRDMTTLSTGWYVAASDMEFNSRLIVSGDVHLIIADGVTLTANQGIRVSNSDPQNFLSIYGQNTDTGRLVAKSPDSGKAAIGGDYKQVAGWISIYGANVEAYGKDGSAGIGSGGEGRLHGEGYGGTINIYGGTVLAKGSQQTSSSEEYYGAAIGGSYGCDGCSVSVYGGNVTAIGPSNNYSYLPRGAAAIGGGCRKWEVQMGEFPAEFAEAGTGASFSHYGGTVTATSGEYTSPIGGGANTVDVEDYTYGAGAGISLDCFRGTLVTLNGVIQSRDKRYAACESKHSTVVLSVCQHEECVYTPVDNYYHECQCSYCAITTIHTHNVGEDGYCTECNYRKRFSIKCEQAPFGTITADKTVAFAGETVTLTITPDEGYVIGSVSVNNRKITPINGVYSFTAVAENMEVGLYFVKLHTVTFDSAGGSAVESQLVVSGNLAEVPPAPEREGYTFLGWYLGNERFSFYMKVTKDIKVTARWQIGARLVGHSISLDGDIGVNFYMEIPQEVAASSDAYVLFTLPSGVEKVYVNEQSDPSLPYATVESVTINGVTKSYYVFKCNVAAKNMTSQIKAQLIHGNEKGEVYTYTVQAYAEYILKNAASYSEELISLVKAMLNYGASAQAYFGIGGTAANVTQYMSAADRIVEGIDLDTFDVADPVISELPDGVTFEGATLSLKSETTLSLYFTGSEELQFSVPGMTVETATVGSYKVARIRGINAAKIGTPITLKVTVGTQTYEVTYGALNYVKNVLSGDYDPKLQAVVTALYRFYEAAANYSSPS